MQQGKQQPQHQPADGPAFWNITHNFKPGELESDLSKMFFNQALDLHKENEALKQRIKRLEEALHRIANTDYRGHRSTESQIAFQVLTEAKP
jgi:pSer/pThr/pTyr-binding forkhead associated (FHA) protein